MKKYLAAVLALCMMLSIMTMPVAFAAGVTVLSTQNLSVDGKTIPCEKYNIDGSNYFKLRDMAYLLNGTAAQFSVGWDAASSTVSITTGQPYTLNGTELKLDGGDKSATSVPSSQTIKIDGAVVSNLSVYNIGGNNYFKLRDLGLALGFEVGYDAATFTATVFTPVDEIVCLPVKKTVDADGFITESAYVYDENGDLIEVRGGADIDNPTFLELVTYAGLEKEVYRMEQSYEGMMEPCYSERYTYDSYKKLVAYEKLDLKYGGSLNQTYDSHGNLVWEREEGTFQTTEYTYDHTYDASGKLVKTVMNDQMAQKILKTSTYHYDAVGKLISKVVVDQWNDTETYTYTYDAAGNLTQEKLDSTWGGAYTTTYTYDADGNMIQSVYREVIEDGLIYQITTTMEYEWWYIEQ